MEDERANINLNEICGPALHAGNNLDRPCLPEYRHWPSAQPSETSRRLTEETIRQLQEATGFIGNLLPAALFRQLFEKRLANFVDQLIAFDRDVAIHGLATASRQLLHRIVPGYCANVAPSTPRQGPLLIVSNHPGLYDALALAASIPRGDLRIVAREQPYWTLMPNVAACLIRVTDDRTSWRQSLRKIISHLSAGGCLLLFPGGKIELDPAHDTVSKNRCVDWSRSPEWLARQVDDLAILPAAVGGVISPAALRNPLSWLRVHRRNRRWLAATIQFLFSRNDDLNMQVRLGETIHTKRWNLSRDGDALRGHIHGAVSDLLDQSW